MIYGVCESYIPGMFYGLQTEEDCCLADGSVWRVISPVYLVRKRKDPRATVYREGKRHFLKVRGMPEEVEVEPVWLNEFTLEIPADWGRHRDRRLSAQLEIGETIDAALKKWRGLWAWIMESGKRPEQIVPDFVYNLDEEFADDIDEDFDRGPAW